MRYCGHFLIKAEGGAKNYKRDHPLPLAYPLPSLSCSERDKVYCNEMRSFCGEVLTDK